MKLFLTGASLGWVSSSLGLMMVNMANAGTVIMGVLLCAGWCIWAWR